MKEFKSYSPALIIAFLIGMILAGTLNFLADPEDLFAFKELKGFNDWKTHQLGERIRRASQIRRGKYDIIVLGSSTVRRLELGHPAFQSRSAYKLMIMGTNFYELYQIFRFVRRHQPHSELIVALDFFSFSNRKTVSGDFEDSFFSQRNPRLLKFNYLLSYSVLAGSIKTVMASYRNRGTNQNPDPTAPPNPAPGSGSLRNRFFRYLFHGLTGVRGELSPDTYGEDRILMLKALMEECRRNGIQLHIYVSPLHALRMESLYVLGLWPTYARWLRDLARVTDESNRVNPDLPPIELWDFSGYNSVTTADLPAADDLAANMLWWVDYEHFQRQLSDVILDTIMHHQEPARPRPADFGIILTPQNVESHLAEMAAAQEQYQQTHPQEVKEIEEMVLKTNRFREPGYGLVLSNP
jgi:hypothetical protein